MTNCHVEKKFKYIALFFTCFLVKICVISQQCKPVVRFINCNAKNENNEIWEWKTWRTYKILAQTTQGCPDSKMFYSWAIENYKAEMQSSDPFFYIEKYSLEIGAYQVQSLIKEISSKGESAEVKTTCWIRIVPSQPLAIIGGGSYKTNPAGKSFTVTGQMSLNFDSLPNSKVMLRYEWKIKLKGKTYIKKKSKFTIGKKQCQDGSKFDISLQVYGSKGESSESSTQTVICKKEAKSLFLSCRKNCPRAGNFLSNNNLGIVMRVKPKLFNYEWSLADENNLHEEKIKLPNLNSDVFVMKEDEVRKKMLPGKSYMIKVNILNDIGEAAMSIKMNSLSIDEVKKGQCNIEPKSGISLKTKFSVTCFGFKKHLSYLIYQTSEDSNNLFLKGNVLSGILIASSYVPKIEFILSHNGQNEIFIQITDSSGYYEIQKLAVKITSYLDQAKTPQEKMNLIEKVYSGQNNDDSFKHLTKNNLVDESIQMANILIDDLNSLPPGKDDLESQLISKFQLDMKKKIINNLLKMPLKGEKEFKQIASLTTKLVPKNQGVDSNYLAILSRLCRKSAQAQVDVNRREKFIFSHSSSVKETNKFLMGCVDSVFDMKVTDIAMTTSTTPNPNIEEVVLTEDYLSYDEMQKTDSKSQLTAAITDNIKTLELMGQALGSALTDDEEPETYSSKSGSVTIKTQSAKEFSESPLQGKGVEIRMNVLNKNGSSPKFNTLYSVLTVFDKEKNPFYWTEGSDKIITNIVDVNVFTNNENSDVKNGSDIKITHFSEPIDIFLEIIRRVTIPLINGNVSAPFNLNEWTPDNLDYNMTIHRVSIPKNTNMILELKPEKKVQLVVIPGRRPKTSDFLKEAIIIEGLKNIIFTPEESFMERDFWWYIAVLPHKSLVANNSIERKQITVSYSLRLSTQKCCHWNPKNLTWDSEGCKIQETTKKDHMHCTCDHLTTFVGMEDILESKREKIKVIDFEIELQVDYKIFAFLCALFLLFSIILGIYAFQKRSHALKPKKQTIFLSDNIRNERYAYLIIAKTGNRKNSGTTSNVTIKLLGSKCSSKPHVLNFPDPHRKFLQTNNEDYFLLTTETHLGQIKQVEIWIDSVGARPSWLCKTLNIYDIQTYQEFYFKIEEWLSVLDKGRPHLKAGAYIESQKQSKFKKGTKLKTICTHLKNQKLFRGATFSICFGEEGMSFMAKTTLLLTRTLLTGSFTLMYLGIPEIRLADSLSFGHFYLPTKFYIATGVALGCAFAIQIVFDVFLRFTWRKKRKIGLILIWSFLITLIISSSSFLIFFGFWVSHLTGWLWLLSVSVSLVLMIFVLEIIYQWINIIFNWSTKTVKFSDRVDVIKEEFFKKLKEIERQRNVLFKKFGDVLLRPYLRFKYYPMSRQKYLKKKIDEETKLEIKELVKELIFFVMYCLVLFYLLLAHLDNQMVDSYERMKEMMVDGVFTKSFSFESVQTMNDVFDYLNTLIVATHPKEWYTDWNKVDPGLLTDFCTRILGIVQLRQLRVRSNTCVVPKKMQILNLPCDSDYSTTYDGDFQDKLENSDVRDRNTTMKEIWVMKTPSEIGTGSYKAELQTYPGNGYVATFGRTFENTLYNLNYLKKQDWLDEYTRVLFVEFWTYNPNHNVFNALKLVFEKSVSGLIVTSYQIRTVRLIISNFTRQILLIACLIVFFILTLRFIVYHFKLVITQCKKYFKNFWNYLDLLIITLTLGCFICYIYDEIITGQLLRELDESKSNRLVKFFKVFKFHRIFTCLSALLICLCVVRMWKFLSFMRTFKLMEHTIKAALLPLAALFFCHVVILMAFTTSGWLLFGGYFPIFGTFFQTLATILLMSINMRSWDDFEGEVYFKVVYFYYLVFMYVTLILSTFYVTVLMFYYAKSDESYVGGGLFDVCRFLKNEVKYYKELGKVKWKNRRLRGGTDVFVNEQGRDRFGQAYAKFEQVKAKPDQFRYAHCEFLNKPKLNLMKAIAKGVVHNVEKRRKDLHVLGRKDFGVMKDVAACVCRLILEEDKENEIFFISEQGDVVPDERLKQMEFVVKKILRKEEEDYLKEEVLQLSFLDRLKNMEGALDAILNVLYNINVY